MRPLALALAAAALLLAPAAQAGTVVYGTVGPAYKIALKTAAGKPVRSLPAGMVTFRIRDRSVDHNFHLQGPGLERTTELGQVGAVTWRVRLRAGARYTFRCDPHQVIMYGAFRAV